MASMTNVVDAFFLLYVSVRRIILTDMRLVREG